MTPIINRPADQQGIDGKDTNSKLPIYLTDSTPERAPYPLTLVGAHDLENLLVGQQAIALLGFVEDGIHHGVVGG